MDRPKIFVEKGYRWINTGNRMLMIHNVAMERIPLTEDRWRLVRFDPLDRAWPLGGGQSYSEDEALRQCVQTSTGQKMPKVVPAMTPGGVIAFLAAATPFGIFFNGWGAFAALATFMLASYLWIASGDDDE